MNTTLVASTLTSQLMIDTAKGSFLGGKRIRLLEAIASHRSILQAVLVRLSNQLTQSGAQDIAEFRHILRKLTMKTSARNQFAGLIGAIRTGVVESEVMLKLGPSLELTAIVTNESVQNLGLAEGRNVLAFVKALSIVLMVDEADARVSARNRFRGLVQQIHHGPVNTEVTLNLPGGHHFLTAVVTDLSVERLGLAVGQPVTAILKASSVFFVSTD